MLTTAEHALRRALDYLVSHGTALDPHVILDTMKLVEEAMQGPAEDVLPRVMEKVARHFELRPPRLPEPHPPFVRHSMGYGRER